ncbi:MAG: extracellular solute-binding protein [Acidobacteriota bacterium]
MIVLLTLSFTCLGCQSGGRTEEGDASAVRIKYWSATNPNEVELARQIARDWKAQHPHILVEVEPIPASISSEEVLLASIAGGTTPDLCSNIWPGALEQYIEADGLVRLDDFPDFFTVMLARMPENVLQRFRSEDGHYYQAPWKTNPIMMQINLRMFRQAGIDHPPRTYTEFLDLATKLTRDTDGDGEIDHWLLSIDLQPVWYKRMFDFYPFYLAATGGKALVQGSKILFDNQAAVEVFRLFRELFRRGAVIKSLSYTDPFLQEIVAVKPNVGPWSIADIERKRPGQMEYAYAPLPLPDGVPGPAVTFGDYKNVAIFSSCRHPQAAWEFVQFMISKENDLRLLEVTDQLPIRGGLLDDPVFANFFQRNPKLIGFAQQALNTRGTDTAPELKEIFDALAQEFEACAILGLKSPEQAVKDAARRSRLILSLR